MHWLEQGTFQVFTAVFCVSMPESAGVWSPRPLSCEQAHGGGVAHSLGPAHQPTCPLYFNHAPAISVFLTTCFSHLCDLGAHFCSSSALFFILCLVATETTRPCKLGSMFLLKLHSGSSLHFSAQPCTMHLALLCTSYPCFLGFSLSGFPSVPWRCCHRTLACAVLEVIPPCPVTGTCSSSN